MNYKFALLTAMVAGLLPVAAAAQAVPDAPQQATPAATAAPAAAPAPAPAAAAPAAAATPDATAAAAQKASAIVPPSAFPARIALISFTEAVAYTNEGQRAVGELRKKYQPQKEKLDALGAEIDSLKKQLQAAPATLSDDDRSSRQKTIDTKTKQFERDGEDAQTAYNADFNEAMGKIAQKFQVVLFKYVNDNGYTLLLNAGDQSSPVMWVASQPNADITLAVIEAYNTASKVAPPAANPAAARKPATTTPHTTPAKPATAK